jgi:hypothetical protein
MKFYMSYWSNGYYGELDEYMLDIHRLSVHLVNKHYGECHLITDSNSKKYFSELPFASISTHLDTVPVQKNNWALGKLYAYNFLSKNNIPFCHIDYDVFLWKSLPETLLKSEVFCQHKEEKVYDLYSFYMLKKYNINTHLIGRIPDRNEKTIAFNVGIFGGNNLEFIEKYSSSAIDFAIDKHNQECYNEISKVQKHPIPCITEQYYLYVCSQKFNQNVQFLLNGKMQDYENEASELGYTHLIGYKSHPKTKEAVYLKLYEHGLKELKYS